MTMNPFVIIQIIVIKRIRIPQRSIIKTPLAVTIYT